MKIQVLFFAQLRELMGSDSSAYEVGSAETVEGLTQQVLKDPRLVSVKELPLLYAVDEVFVPKETILKDRQTLALLTPVSGGA